MLTVLADDAKHDDTTCSHNSMQRQQDHRHMHIRPLSQCNPTAQTLKPVCWRLDQVRGAVDCLHPHPQYANRCTPCTSHLCTPCASNAALLPVLSPRLHKSSSALHAVAPCTSLASSVPQHNLSKHDECQSMVPTIGHVSCAEPRENGALACCSWQAVEPGNGTACSTGPTIHKIPAWQGTPRP